MCLLQDKINKELVISIYIARRVADQKMCVLLSRQLTSSYSRPNMYMINRVDV